MDESKPLFVQIAERGSMAAAATALFFGWPS